MFNPETEPKYNWNNKNVNKNKRTYEHKWTYILNFLKTLSFEKFINEKIYFFIIYLINEIK